jgi:hypothetical protein
MDNSKENKTKPKTALHVWSNPHLNTLVVMTHRNSNIVKTSQDYTENVNLCQDLTLKPVNFF